MLDERTRRFLETNVKGLLQDTLDWMEQRNAELREHSPFADATLADAKFFACLRGRERALSDVARTLGVSRQAAHHTAHRLVVQGVIELVPSPHDGREKLVRITPHGNAAQVLAARNLRQIERELARNIGRDNVELVRDLLVKHLETVKKGGDD
jgi:DNA-binding MarR family transcriptional regulator